MSLTRGPVRRGTLVPWLLVALSPAFAFAGFALGSRWLFPILCSLPAWVAMVALLRRSGRAEAIAAMLLWALLLGGSTTLLCAALPGRAADVVLHGTGYWDEMSRWLETGQGREADPAGFLPQHLLHAVLFIALSLATASLVSIAFGAVLMNYMAYYVARVALLAPAHPVLAGLLAWHPWSVVRVASYVVLGVCLAEPLLARLGGGGWPAAGRRRWIAAALAGLLLDAALKAALAPHWHALLRSLR